MQAPVVGIIVVLVGIIGLVAGFFLRKYLGEAKVGFAEERAQKLLAEAKKDGEAKKKEDLLEAKEQIHNLRAESDRENREVRKNLQRLEKRIVQGEESLANRLDEIGRREKALILEEQKITQRSSDLEKIYTEEKERLEKLAELSVEEARELLLKKVEEETRRDSAKLIREIETRAREDGEKRARNIISLAIQRLSSDQVAETTVSVVPLPNDDMKGRIIGREGRNIRAFEKLTGINLIIDDTPEAVILSGFNPLRREIARLTLEKLIIDGRIHPARIEEMFEKATNEVEAEIREEGEQAAFEVGVQGLHPELIRVLGKLKFRTSYGQNVLRHSVEVAHLAGIMAAELGSDIKLAKRGGFLHDIGKAIDQEVEGAHGTLGSELAKRLGETPQVCHAIEGHHGEVDPTTVEAVLVQSADALSAARPGARRETLESYIKRLEKLETIADSYEGVEKTYAMQAGREIRVMVKPEKIADNATDLLAKEVAQRIEEEMEYPGQVKVTVIREHRAVEYAK
ncbi:MAG TPA: ribonuclease Y [Candidatus Subteraquimicrobiales bacterium]